jgi:hypothetical protein
MLGLKVAVVAMGILIVAGVAVLGLTLVNRMSAYGGGNASPGMGVVGAVMLDEPEGTRIAGVSMAPERLAVRLQGGGPDRVVVVDTRGGHVVGRVGLLR